jgi:hypothetical protein
VVRSLFFYTRSAMGWEHSHMRGNVAANAPLLSIRILLDFLFFFQCKSGEI